MKRFDYCVHRAKWAHSKARKSTVVVVCVHTCVCVSEGSAKQYKYNKQDF
jgi:hypothetical protein